MVPLLHTAHPALCSNTYWISWALIWQLHLLFSRTWQTIPWGSHCSTTPLPCSVVKTNLQTPWLETPQLEGNSQTQGLLVSMRKYHIIFISWNLFPLMQGAAGCFIFLKNLKLPKFLLYFCYQFKWLATDQEISSHYLTPGWFPTQHPVIHSWLRHFGLLCRYTEAEWLSPHGFSTFTYKLRLCMYIPIPLHYSVMRNSFLYPKFQG